MKTRGRYRGRKCSSVGRWIRNRLRIVCRALNQPAPLHVIEEKRLLLLGIVELAECDRAARVEAKNVQPQFPDGIWRTIQMCYWVKEVTSIKCIVAIEFPCGSVKSARAGLEHHGHRSGR